MKPYLRVANVFEDRIDLNDVKEMHFDAAEFERYRLHPGDVLLNEGQSPEWLGRPALYSGQREELAFTNSLIRFQAGPGVEPRWALAVFRHHMHSGRFTRESRITTNIAHLSIGRLQTVEFPVPPLDEQRRIVDLLEDHLSRLNAAGAYLAASKRRIVALKRSALDLHFGGADVPLSDLIEDISAGKSFGAASAPAADGEWGIVKVSAMTWGEFNQLENKAVTDVSRVDPRFEIREGDLLVSRANTAEYVGSSVLVGPVRPKLLLSDKSLRVTPHATVETEWLWRALQAPSARKQVTDLATGTKDSMRNISQAALKQIRLPKADHGDQVAALKAFGEVEQATADLRQEIVAGEKRLGALRRSLLAAAFSGRLTSVLSEVGATIAV
jgi:type I restriction enzyme, S subunit